MTGTPTKYEGIVKLGPNKYNIRVRATCPRSGMRKEVERVRECSLLEAHALQLQWQTELKRIVSRAAAATRRGSASRTSCPRG